MESKILYIKNMVCPRCIWAVENVLNDLKIIYDSVSIGKVNLASSIENIARTELNKKLRNIGFEIVEEKRKQIVEKIKSMVIYWVRNSTEKERLTNFSNFLSSMLKRDYRYLSTVFSDIEHKTIEKYLIQHKIERIKEYLIYEDLSISEISYKMGYSSHAHLSVQFKQVTGMSPSQFKEMIKMRKL